MRKILSVLSVVVYGFSVPCCCAEEMGGNNTIQTESIRNSCKEAQQCEKNITDLSASIENLEKQEKTTIPVVRDVYRILMRCFTVLFDIQRFSKFLAFSQQNNKNDFIRASIIIKNFATYFGNVGAELKKTNNDITNLRAKRSELKAALESNQQRYSQLCAQINDEAVKLTNARSDENVIREDVVYHLANKSETIEELDAELEAENAVGVLKNTKVSTDLSIVFPVAGRLINEFGDRGINDEMIHYMAFEVRPGAIVTAPSKGLVVFSGKFLNYDNMVIISNGEYRLFLYGLGELFVTTGDIVEIGDYIGRMPLDIKEGKVSVKLELKRSGESLDPRHWIQESEEKKRKAK